jgi:hypothetical protein
MELSSSVRAQIRLGFREAIPLQIDLRSLQECSRFHGAAFDEEVVKRSVLVYCIHTHLVYFIVQSAHFREFAHQVAISDLFRILSIFPLPEPLLQYIVPKMDDRVYLTTLDYTGYASHIPAHALVEVACVKSQRPQGEC